MKSSSGFRLRLLAVLLLVFIPCAVLLYLEAAADHDEAMAAAQSSAQYVASSNAREASAVFAKMQVTLETLSAAPSARERNWDRLEEYCRRLKARNPEYLNVGIVDESGVIRVSSLPLTQRYDVSDRDYFRFALRDDRFVIGDYQVGRVTGQPSIGCGYPLKDEAGRIWGVAYIAVDLAAVQEALGREPMPEGTVATLMDDEGRVLAREPLDGSTIGATTPDRKVLAAAVDDEGGFPTIRGVDGVARVYGFADVFETEDQSLHVAAGIDRNKLFAGEMRSYALRLAGLAGCGVLVLLVAAWATHTIVLGQIRSLTGVVHRLAEGDLGAREHLPACDDEIGELSAECHALATTIASYFERMERSEQHARDLARLLPVAVIALRGSGTVAFANDAGLRMLGLARLPRKGLALADRVDAEQRAALATYLTAVTSGEHPAPVEIGIRASDGHRTEVEFAATPLDGEERAILAVASDISERKAVEQLKSDFLSMVSHELRTPLTSIAGFSQLLAMREHQDPEQVTRLAGRIEERASHLTRLVEDLLRVLQAEATSFCGEKRPTDIRAVVERTIDGIAIPSTHSVEIRAPKRLRQVSCDEKAVGHAVANLVSNAVKFSPEGGPVVVRISQRRDGATSISVSDEGVGVPAETRDAIFERFVQADMSSTRGFDGFGLGLFIVRQVAEAHGGSVSVKDGAAGGSVFTLELGSVA